MKYRQGFVSNSSSSSFILILKEDHPFLNEIEDYQGSDEACKHETFFDIIRRKNGEVIVFGTKSNHDPFFHRVKGSEYYTYE